MAKSVLAGKPQSYINAAERFAAYLLALEEFS
jgi:hypothetical protein